MNRTLIFGRWTRAASTISLPFIPPGSPTSLISRSIFTSCEKEIVVVLSSASAASIESSVAVVDHLTSLVSHLHETSRAR